MASAAERQRACRQARHDRQSARLEECADLAEVKDGQGRPVVVIEEVDEKVVVLLLDAEGELLASWPDPAPKASAEDAEAEIERRAQELAGQQLAAGNRTSTAQVGV